MIIETYPQRSFEWYQAKGGIPGASSFSKIITTKGVPSKSATDLIYQLAGERLLGRVEEGFTSYAMQQGIDREDEARAFYELITGKDVQQAGFIFKNEQKKVGCSPDGLTENSGLEIKCPIMKTHVKYLLDPESLYKEYFQQVQGSMWVCGRDVWDILSYYPDMPVVLLTVKRDNEWISKLEEEMLKFLKELDRVYQRLMEKVA